MYCLSSFEFLSPNILYRHYLFIHHTNNKPVPLNTIANESNNITLMNCVVNNDGIVSDDFSSQSGGDAPSTVSETELDGNQATEEEVLPPVLETELVINHGNRLVRLCFCTCSCWSAQWLWWRWVRFASGGRRSGDLGRCSGRRARAAERINNKTATQRVTAGRRIKRVKSCFCCVCVRWDDISKYYPHPSTE